MVTFDHDPDAVLDYTFDWSAYLQEGETIASHDVSVASGTITIDSTAADDSTVTVWVSGAEGRDVSLTCRVTTNQGRTDDRTLTLVVKER